MPITNFAVVKKYSMTLIHSSDIEQANCELSTILDMLRWTVSQFNQADLFFGHGTDNSWDEAVCLVMHVLHLEQDMIQRTDEHVLNAKLLTAEKVAIAELVARRVNQRLPLAYLTNQAWFCGLPFFVDERVLVPRSPFAEYIEKRFAPWITSEPEHILDLCTGSACIAIALAYEFPDALVDAVDISDDALAVAEINIQEHDLIGRVFPIKSDLMQALTGQSYDLIVSNPPYVDAEDMDDLPEEFHREPELGLAAGEDGLSLVDNILRQAVDHLKPRGWLFVEVGNSQVHMMEKYPDLAVEWLDFERGGHGVFAISAEALSAFWRKKTNRNN